MPHSRTPLATLVAALLIAAGLIGRQLSDRFVAQTLPPVACQGTYMCNKIERGSTCQQVTPSCLPEYALQCDGVACGGGCGGTCCRCVPAGATAQSSSFAQTSSIGVVQISSTITSSSRSSSRSSSVATIVPIACTDTDGGDNPAVLGTARALNIAYEEKCVVYQDLGGGFGWHSVAECFPRPDPQTGVAYCTAVEYWCSGSNFNPVGYRHTRCELGCRNGLCLTAQTISQRSSSSRISEPPPTCVDTDGGWNIYQRSYYGQTGGTTNEEYCVLLNCPSGQNCTQTRVQSCGRSNFCMVYEFQCGPGGLLNGAHGGLQNCYNGCTAGTCTRPVTGTSGTTGNANVCQSPQQCGTTQCGSCDNVGSECKRICKVPTCAGGLCDSTYAWETCAPSACQ